MITNVDEIDATEVSVRWHDGYLETFQASEVRFGSDLLWMRLTDGDNRHIPLRSIRWWSLSRESHAPSTLRAAICDTPPEVPGS